MMHLSVEIDQAPTTISILKRLKQSPLSQAICRLRLSGKLAVLPSKTGDIFYYNRLMNLNKWVLALPICLSKQLSKSMV